MRESRTYGSVRGALSNERPYRDRFARNDECGGQSCPCCGKVSPNVLTRSAICSGER